MLVKRIRCDRCSAEFSPHSERGVRLFASYGRQVFVGPAQEHGTLDLCGTCRDSLATWLADAGQRLPGLTLHPQRTTLTSMSEPCILPPLLMPSARVRPDAYRLVVHRPPPPSREHQPAQARVTSRVV